jgi:anti-sigma regulatory factor (Ser/Thr protein kinase)
MEMENKFKSSLKSLSDVREAVGRFCQEFDIDKIKCSEIELAVNEACTNIITHGGLDPEKDSFSLSLEKAKKMLVIIIRDPGKPYNFNQVNTVKSRKEFKEKRPRSGMGVYIIRQLVDAVMYHRLPDNTNELKLIKNL